MLIRVTCVPLRTLVVGACVRLTCWALGSRRVGLRNAQYDQQWEPAQS